VSVWLLCRHCGDCYDALNSGSCFASPVSSQGSVWRRKAAWRIAMILLVCKTLEISLSVCTRARSSGQPRRNRDNQRARVLLLSCQSGARSDAFKPKSEMFKMVQETEACICDHGASWGTSVIALVCKTLSVCTRARSKSSSSGHRVAHQLSVWPSVGVVSVAMICEIQRLKLHESAFRTGLFIELSLKDQSRIESCNDFARV
jgi:hypothetical protein